MLDSQSGNGSLGSMLKTQPFYTNLFCSITWKYSISVLLDLEKVTENSLFKELSPYPTPKYWSCWLNIMEVHLTGMRGKTSTAVKDMFKHLTISKIKLSPVRCTAGEAFQYVAHRDKLVTDFIERGTFFLQTEHEREKFMRCKHLLLDEAVISLQEWHQITIKFTMVMITAESSIRTGYWIFSLTRSFQAQLTKAAFIITRSTWVAQD